MACVILPDVSDGVVFFGGLTPPNRIFEKRIILKRFLKWGN